LVTLDKLIITHAPTSSNSVDPQQGVEG
jgi:hypothetical protein